MKPPAFLNVSNTFVVVFVSILLNSSPYLNNDKINGTPNNNTKGKIKINQKGMILLYLLLSNQYLSIS